MLKLAAILSEFLLYLIPIIVLLRDFYYIYKKRKELQDQYYATLYILPFVSIILSIKALLIIFKDLYSILFVYVVFIDLGFSLFLGIFIVILIKKVINILDINSVQFRWWDFFVPAGAFILVVVNRNFVYWFDFWTYCVVGAGVLFVSIFFARLDTRFWKYAIFNTVLIYINAVFALFFPKFVYSYVGVIYLSLVGIAIVISTAREAHVFVLNHLKVLKVPDEVYRWHLKTMLRALSVAVVISALSITAIASSTVYIINVNKKAESELKQMVFQDSSMVASNTQHILTNLNGGVILLPLRINSIDDYENIEKSLSSVFDPYRDDFYYFDVVNNKGLIVAAYPWDSQVGDFVLNKGYAERVLLTHKPTVSPLYSTEHGFHTFFICYPLFNGGKNSRRFIGFVEGAVNLNIFKDALVDLGKETAFSVQSVIYENGIAIESTGEIPPLSSIADFYNYLLKGKSLFYKKTEFRFLNSEFGVISYVPKSALTNYVQDVLHKILVALFLILFALLYVMYLVVLMLRNVDFHLGKAVEHAIEREEDARKSAVDVSQRLMKLTEFFDSISFGQPDEIFYKNLLELAIRVMPSAQKGSIALKKGDYLEFVAAYGYPLNILQKSRLPYEKQKTEIKGKTTVINKIRKVDLEVFTEDELEGIKQVGGEDIKSTLIASVLTKGEYFGSLFIDNLDRENAFTEEDIKIAEAISNVVSMFSESKIYINKINQSVKIDEMLVSMMQELRVNRKSRSIMPQVLSMLQKEVSEDIIGTGAVVHSVTGLLKLCASKNVQSEIPIERFKVNVQNPQFIQASDIEDVFWTNSMKSIYFVPDKKLSGEGICIGFAKPENEMPVDMLEFLNMLLPSVHDIISNMELSKELSRVYIELLISMIHSIELKDPYTRNHSERVTVFAYMLGKRYGLSMRDLRVLYHAAMLHDVGKVGIPDEILKKQGKLTEEEYEVIKQHPQIGADMIMDVTFLKDASYIILFHHEHYDGSGYPAHLKGDQIPLLSRIISIVDAFDAMITRRPYKRPYTIDETIEFLKNAEGMQFDPKLTELFIEMLKNERSKFEEVMKNPDVMSIYEELFEL